MALRAVQLAHNMLKHLLQLIYLENYLPGAVRGGAVEAFAKATVKVWRRVQGLCQHLMMQLHNFCFVAQCCRVNVNAYAAADDFLAHNLTSWANAGCANRGRHLAVVSAGVSGTCVVVPP